MRCQCCNIILSDYEATIRHKTLNHFLDICKKCLKDLHIPYIGREDLNNVPNNLQEAEDWWEDNDQSTDEV